MNEFNQTPESKIEKYKARLNQRDQDEIMGSLNHFNSPLLNLLGRPNAVFENNIVDYINKNPVDPNLKGTVDSTSTSSDTTSSVGTSNATPAIGSDTFSRLKSTIIKNESNGDYKAVNMNTNNGKKGSGAWGAYQFIWNWHGDKIKDLFGISKPEEFRDNPELQDKYFEYHYDTFLRPKTEVFKMRFPNSGLTDIQIMEGLHFRGADGKGGMFEIFEKGLQDSKLEANNPTLTERLKT